MDTTFILYHSFMPFESGFYSENIRKEANYEAEMELNQRLQEKANKFSNNKYNADISIFLDRGSEEKGILNFVKVNKTDLIIMGTTGATGLKEKIIGSVTADVMCKSSCPVIGIPEKYRGGALKNIAFCSNYELLDIQALKLLYKWATRWQANIQIWHFHEKDASVDSEDKLSTDYKEMVSKVLGDQHISFHFSSTANVANELDKLARHKDLDLIAMITHRRKSFFTRLLNKGLTKKVAFHTEIPLLAIPSE